MTYKIYTYSTQKTVYIHDFQNFIISPINNDEFIISNKNHKISVKSGEIFKCYGETYFIFNPNSLTFLYEQKKQHKFSFFYFDLKKIYTEFKFKQYRRFILFLLILFYVTQLSFLDY